ncbi:hypothetical protein IT575_13865 [bacterium]|nr:hypothetical protein [bacterium]
MRPWERQSSGLSEAGAFVAGVARDSAGGAASDKGQALALSSGSPGAGEFSHAIYRLQLGGAEPGLVSVDINLLPRSGGSGISTYFVALSEYSSGRWVWRGPFSDGQIALGCGREVAAGASYLSGAGSLYVAIAVQDGSALDVVGIGAEAFDPADTTAPPTPQGTTATAVAGGLELQWNEVLAADLAGYLIYYRSTDFDDPANSGVKLLPYLEGSTRTLLSGISGQTFVRIAALDYSGNHSGLSSAGIGSPLPGSAPELLVDTSDTEARTGAGVLLSVSGADSYDLDLDGDGSFELIGDSAGLYSVDTSQTGVIRPRVRGSSGSEKVAYGGVSLIVAANFPPVAKLSVNPPQGTLWGGDQLDVVYDAGASTDDGAGPLEYAYDPNGDGVFGSFSSSTVANRSLTAPGVYLSAVQVRDSEGLSAYGYCVLHVRQAAGFETSLPNAAGSGYSASLAMVAGRPAIVCNRSATGGLVFCRARDAEGRSWHLPILLTATNGNGSQTALAEIGGRPAVLYHSVNDSRIKYARALNDDGSQPTDWAAALDVITPVTPLGERLGLLEVEGQPAAAWINPGDNKVYYERANGIGDNQADWNGSALEVGNLAADDLCMLLVAGRPALFWRDTLNDVFYERSSTTTGDTGASWAGSQVAIDNSLSIADGVSAAIVAGRPAVVFVVDFGTSGELSFSRSTTATGEDSADWPAPQAITSIDGYTTLSPALADVDGLPAVAFGAPLLGSGDQTCFVRALDVSGDTWGQLQPAGSLGLDAQGGLLNNIIASPGWVGISSQAPSGRLDFDSLIRE